MCRIWEVNRQKTFSRINWFSLPRTSQDWKKKLIFFLSFFLNKWLFTSLTWPHLDLWLSFCFLSDLSTHIYPTQQSILSFSGDILKYYYISISVKLRITLRKLRSLLSMWVSCLANVINYAQHLETHASLRPRGVSSCARTTPARATCVFTPRGITVALFFLFFFFSTGSRCMRNTQHGESSWRDSSLRHQHLLIYFIFNIQTRPRSDAHSPLRRQSADTPPAGRAAAVPTSSCCCPASRQFDGPGIYGGAREPPLLCGARGGTAAPSRDCALVRAPFTCAADIRR